MAKTAAVVAIDSKTDSLVPKKHEGFVPFGCYQEISDIIEGREFFPVFITGPTRCGKTLSIYQACAEQGRHLYAPNITSETDEIDLIGGYTLINGETVWNDGPAVLAAEDPDGGILLLDEIDLGSNKLLCMQTLLDGKPYFLKKRNRWVYPKPGFNIFATANTKGKGSESGKYVGANIMNEAMLERFAATYEQDYPTKAIETRILREVLDRYNIKSGDFVDTLCTWAKSLRESYNNGGGDETMSTGRLIHIVKAYALFKRNRYKAIHRCIARFDEVNKTAFLSAYQVMDPKMIDGPDDVPLFSAFPSATGMPAPAPEPKKLTAW